MWINRRLLRVATASFAAGMVLLGRPALAVSSDFRRQCEQRLPQPSLVVRGADNGYSIDRRLSYRELTGMGAALLRHGKRNVLGITRAEAATRVEMKLARLDDVSGGQACLSPQVAITIEYKALKVYIGREFPPGSCAYQEILQHEMRHVQTYQYHLPRLQAAVQARLTQRFGPRLIYGTSGTLEGQLKAQVYSDWLLVVDQELRKINGFQAQIDSAAEYGRMERVCDGEVQRLLGLGT